MPAGPDQGREARQRSGGASRLGHQPSGADEVSEGGPDAYRAGEHGAIVTSSIPPTKPVLRESNVYPKTAPIAFCS
jgi:hypothetical protein